MKRTAILATTASLLLSGVAVGGTKGGPATEGQLEIRDADLASPNEDVPSVVPLRYTDFDVQIRGFVAEVTVEQQFENVLDRPIEAEYVFPLPHDAAVTATEMWIGERVIRGRIARREEAREAYENAKAQGKRTSLLEQERPNIFTQSVANIGPHETIEVVIRYEQTLAYLDGAYELVLPTVVGRRYVPGRGQSDESEVQPAGHGRSPDTDEVTDASRITPPALAPGQRCGFDIDVQVDIDAGVPIQQVYSRSHRVHVQRAGPRRSHVALADDDRIPNKDFVLNVEVAGERAEVGMVAHHDGQHGYFTLILQPPDAPNNEAIRPCEVICALDCSGSMSGRPLKTAKEAVKRVLASLALTDRFNVIAFSNQAAFFSPEAVAATEKNVKLGIDYVRALESGGGTEMMRGVQAALSTDPPEGVLRIVAFFTDGYIGNDEAIIGEVQRSLGAARLFAFGVGSSVNRYLLDRMGAVGRGATEIILPEDDPAYGIDLFVQRMSDPVWSDVEIDFGDLAVYDLTPAKVPDVFAGAPVYIHGRYDKPAEATIEIAGRLGASASVAEISIVLPPPDDEHSPLPGIWARQRIKELELAKLASADPASVEEQITMLALSYSLMSAYTSFVAAEDTSAILGGGPPELVTVSVPEPEGVTYEKPTNQPAAGGGWGGGPMGPIGLAMVGVMAIVEWRRRSRR